MSITVDRYFLPERNFMLLRGDFDSLFADQQDYWNRHELRRPNREAGAMLRLVFQASVLWTTFQPNGTTTAWSLLLAGPRWRLFTAASMGEGRCVARWLPFEPDQEEARPSLFEAQSQRPGQLLQRSVFEPSRDEFHPLLEEFFSRSQQTQGMMFTEGTAAQMLITLADWDEEWLADLQGRSRQGLVDEKEFGDLRRIGPAQPWRYDCGCDPERLRQAILALAAHDVGSVFGNDATVEVECPRCGREHVLRRP